MACDSAFLLRSLTFPQLFFAARPQVASEIEKTSKDVDDSIKNPFGCNRKKLRTLHAVLEA